MLWGVLPTSRALPALTGFLCLGVALSAFGEPAALVLDERPAQPGEWGYRPADHSVSPTDPPAFSWRPQSGIESWELEVSRDAQFQNVLYHADGIPWNVHCPPQSWGPGRYFWRYRGRSQGRTTNWSQVRNFSIDEKSVRFPMPTREELLRRIPSGHPRLFLRPEDLPKLRAAARGELGEVWKRLVERCERALSNPPPTAEPPKYPPGVTPKSEEWAKIWWGNRMYTIQALGTSALLGFVYQVGGERVYGELAKRILLECAKWDPVGATGFRYNDEAGMPYAYYFSRTYTFVYDLLSEEERQQCRNVMRIRGEEMYRSLCPRHFWQPYNSHANRAWHFLGEVGITFHGEIPEADEWTWFALNVFFNTYPVWCDEDGGWHEGATYWASYLERFTWWADVMRATFGIDAYQKPYFSKAGYYAMYLMPPHAVTGGFGDLACTREAKSNVNLMAILAVQARNPHWMWYVESMGGPPQPREFWEFIRGTLAPVRPQPPTDLPTSRVFRGIGQAALNTTLEDARHNVQILFKSSPFGLQSHGYDANNAFLLTAYNARLFVSSGRRDIHGSEHHVRWMWSTRSVNSITVDGIGQVPHSAATRGQITAFCTSPDVDAVEGEAGDCYLDVRTQQPLLKRFTRSIIFLKPEWIVIYDRLVAHRPVTYQYWLHSPEKMKLGDNHIVAQVGEVRCPVEFLLPLTPLKMTQTNEYDPNPQPHVKVREWHVMADTVQPRPEIEFLALYHPHRVGTDDSPRVDLQVHPGGYILGLTWPGENATLLLPKDEAASLRLGDLETKGRILIRRSRADGSIVRTVVLEGVRPPSP